jgi:hypothetical protein
MPVCRVNWSAIALFSRLLRPPFSRRPFSPSMPNPTADNRHRQPIAARRKRPMMCVLKECRGSPTTDSSDTPKIIKPDEREAIRHRTGYAIDS